VHDEGHVRLERVENRMDSLSCLLLVCLHFWNKGAAFPVVCTLVAWPQNALFVLSIAWLCGGFNKRDPRSLKLILARPTAAGNPTKSRPAHTKVRSLSCLRSLPSLRTDTLYS
jgi:hypothetical protein